MQRNKLFKKLLNTYNISKNYEKKLAFLELPHIIFATF